MAVTRDAAAREAPPREATVNHLINRLAGGWEPPAGPALQELITLWHRQLATTVSIESTVVNGACFTCNLSKIRLFGTDSVWCVVLSGRGPELAEALLRYWATAFAPGRLVCVLTLSDDAHVAARERCASSGCVLSPSQVTAILTQADARQVLKGFLREQIPLRTLIPFDIGVSAGEAMFYGRRNELRKLIEDDRSCIAIAGPTRIGKTTLVKAYLRHLRYERPIRFRSTFYVDLFACADKSDHLLLRFIARQIAPSRWAERVTESDFVGFLRYHFNHYGQLELILDEADDICQRPVVDELLRAAVGQRLCRLIFCGRGALFRAINNTGSPFAGRVTPLHLHPLTSSEAQALLVEPLSDLGLRIAPSDVQEVLQLTGRLPHLLQWYGQRLAELAIDEGTVDLTAQHLDILRWDYGMATYFTGALNELTSDEARLVALCLLRDRRDLFTPALVYELLRPEAEIAHSRIPSVCDELVMQNILTWEAGGYRIASGALAFYAEQLGFLDGVLAEARSALRRARGAAGDGGI